MKVLYNSVKKTLPEIRNRYWIPRGRTFVKHV